MDLSVLRDVAATLGAIALFFLFLIPPGYLIAFAGDLFRFRAQPASTRLAISLPLSIGCSPVFLYLTWRFLGLPWSWCAYAIIWLAFFIVLLRTRTPVSFAWKDPLTIAAAIWCVISIASVVDMPIGNRIYPSAITFDYGFRVPIVQTFVRHPQLPPVNPFFFPGHPVPFRYHYFWFMLTGFVARAGGSLIGSRAALNASTAWAGFGLIAVIRLVLQFFQPLGAVRLGQRAALACAFLLIRGFDALPMLAAQAVWITRHVEIHWLESSIESWTSTLLWVPNHATSLIAFLTGCLCLWAAHSATGKSHLIATLAAGVCFASGVGLSVYLAVLFAPYLFVILCFLLGRGPRSAAIPILASGFLALVLTIPFVLELAGAKTPDSGFAMIAVREDFTPTGFLLRTLHVDSWTLRQVVALCMMPINLVIELGFYFVVGVWKGRALWRSRHSLKPTEKLLAWLLICSLLVGTFVRSVTITNNDLGWRTTLGAQFVLINFGRGCYTIERQCASALAGWIFSCCGMRVQRSGLFFFSSFT